jgi:uncharacterized membrane protein YbaN (DUF454 family)
MKPARRNRRSTSEGVCISTSDGLIGVAAPCLFADPSGAAIHSLIERLFHVDWVREVRVDRIACTVAIEYDASDLPAAIALARFSEVIGKAATNGPTVLGNCLSRIPGHVRRVAKPNRVESPTRAACRTRTSALRHDRRMNRAVMAGELVVEYDAAPEGPSGLARPARLGFLRDGYLTNSFRRPMNLAAAGGCFVMSIVGLVVPGIPTVPFVLATSYFLARSSPALHERLRRSRLFGKMVRDWEQYHGLQLSTKLKLVAVTFVIIGMTIATAGVSLPILIVMGIVTVVSLYIVVRIPTVSDRSLSLGASHERHRDAISAGAFAGA